MIRFHPRDFLVLLLILLSLFALSVVPISSARANDTDRSVVFHIDTSAHMNRSIRQVSRHVEENPDYPVRVILIADGVRPAVEGATDPNGGLYGAQMEQLLAAGVRIFACENTLDSFDLSPDDLTFGIETVRSGVAELGRLQVEQNSAYIKL